MTTFPVRSSAPFLFGCCLLLAGLLPAPAAADELAPHFSFRADHMVLDSAIFESEIFVSTQSGTVSRYDWRSGTDLGFVLQISPVGDQEQPPAARALAISPDGKTLAVASSEGKLRFLRRGPDDSFQADFDTEIATAMRLEFNGPSQLLIGTMRGELILFDVTARKEIYRRELEYDPVYAMAIHEDGKRMALGFRSSRIQIVEIETGDLVRKLSGHRDSIFDLAWLSPTTLVSASKDLHVYLWDLSGANGSVEPHTVFKSDYYISTLAVDPATQHLGLTLNEAATLGILQLPGGELLRSLRGHTSSPQSLAFVDGGKVLISTGNDAQVLVWHLVQ